MNGPESSTSSIIRMELLNKIPGKEKEEELAQEEWRNVSRKSKHSNVEFSLLEVRFMKQSTLHSLICLGLRWMNLLKLIQI